MVEIKFCEVIQSGLQMHVIGEGLSAPAQKGHDGAECTSAPVTVNTRTRSMIKGGRARVILTEEQGKLEQKRREQDALVSAVS